MSQSTYAAPTIPLKKALILSMDWQQATSLKICVSYSMVSTCQRKRMDTITATEAMVSMVAMLVSTSNAMVLMVNTALMVHMEAMAHTEAMVHMETIAIHTIATRMTIQ